MSDEHRLHSRDFVASLDKGLKVLLCFERKHSKLTLAEVARLTGYSPATARRFLMTLEALDYLHSDGKRFWVSPRTLLLARPYLVSRPAPQLAQPILDALAERTRQSASLGILLDNEVLIIARSTGRRTLSTGLAIGSRLPIYCSSIGRAILSTLPQEEVMSYLANASYEQWTPRTVPDIASAAESVARCRSTGWAECDEELELGVRSIAVPIPNASGKAVAALSLSVRAERMTMKAFEDAHLDAIQETRKQLGAAIAFD
ncbi:IclR family transcriptional regulator C-terminal domain-containing protein [Variovorax sp. Sphag1AA]|uniref:IclR family transcriptional regulator domain-containing protein n=1 Tax=Variovorax sp. Sphag1AA TaxID=2587027 RepID=UPI00160724BC|nr:IclR family transcriptional regulator C-terminal domain-containing protein [Variovorax sp. Sphag1AA]MBB3177943.1 IclR family pca regulon transcriptional regulator [Variovorax sp. Sphag1AA]